MSTSRNGEMSDTDRTLENLVEHSQLEMAEAREELERVKNNSDETIEGLGAAKGDTAHTIEKAEEIIKIEKCLSEQIESLTLEVGIKGDEETTLEVLVDELRSTEQKTAGLQDHGQLKEKFDCQQDAKEIRKIKEHEALVDDMKTIRKKFEETKETFEEEIKRVTLTKNLVLKDIRNLKKELLSRLDDIEKNSVETVYKRYKEVTEKMKMTARKIEESLKQIDETLKEFELDKKKRVDRIKKVRGVLHEKEFKINADIERFEGVSVCFDKKIKTLFDRTTSLVKINRPCQANLTKHVDITFEADRETCGISDICSLPDGTVVMTDLSNDCLKRLDASYNRKGNLHLDGGPLGVCTTRYGELAVTLRESRVIQFVECSETEMKPTKSFPADCSCNYICCMDDALFVTCEGGEEDNGLGHIRKFDMTGALLSVIDTDDGDRRMFTTPLHISSNSDKTRLFVTDIDNMVVMLDKTGKKIGQYRNAFLESPFGISVLPNDNILVSSLDLHSVQQFDDKSRHVGTILSKSNGLQNPVCIKYCASSRHLIVSMDDCNSLLVFNTSFPST